MDDLTKHWIGLSLSEKEGPGLCLKKEQAVEEFCLAAKFLTKRALNTDAIAKTFQPLWRSKNGFKVTNMGEHVILFTFDNKYEVERILSSEPWSFDKHLIVLQRYEKDSNIQNMDFNRVVFWVQVHNIPSRFMNQEVAEQICEPIGTICGPQNGPEGDGGGFRRVRIEIDITQPLCRGRIISLEDGQKHWISFKYERLPHFCYWCGRLTHDDRDCERWIDSEGSLSTEDQQFGSWLRAPPFAASRKNVVVVLGLYSKKSGNSTTAPAAPPPKPPATAVPEAVSTVTNAYPDKACAEAEECHNSFPFSDALNGSMAKLSTEDMDHEKQGGQKIPRRQEHINEDELFSAKLSEIDQELQKFDSAEQILRAKNQEVFKEKILKAGDIMPQSGEDIAQPVTNISPKNQPSTVLSDISNYSQPTVGKKIANWTRQVRTKNGTDTIMEDVVGQKRILKEGNIHGGLPTKKRVVSQNEKENQKILAAAGLQPCQKQ